MFDQFSPTMRFKINPLRPRGAAKQIAREVKNTVDKVNPFNKITDVLTSVNPGSSQYKNYLKALNKKPPTK